MKHRRKKRKKHIGHCLKKRYKEVIRKQLEQELYLLSQKDVNSVECKIGYLNNDDTLFNKSSKDSLCVLYGDLYIQNGYASLAALLLIIIRMSKNNIVRESYIYPALFCLRHYLELTMKDSILFLRLRRRRAYAGESNLAGHDLTILWNNLKQYFEKDDPEVKSVERLIIELNYYDSNGELFRYGCSLTKRVFNKDIEMPFVDIDILYKRTIQLYRFFEGVNEWARDGYDEFTNNQ